jgi:DNA-binding NarL/FixJ family response regulator
MTMTRAEYEAQHPLGTVNVQHDGETRPMTEVEWTAWIDQAMEAQAAEQAEADAVVAKETARQSAIDKLAALGLTVDEISAAFGLENN